MYLNVKLGAVGVVCVAFSSVVAAVQTAGQTALAAGHPQVRAAIKRQRTDSQIVTKSNTQWLMPHFSLVLRPTNR